jgi:hypothetical protein
MCGRDGSDVGPLVDHANFHELLLAARRHFMAALWDIRLTLVDMQSARCSVRKGLRGQMDQIAQ